MKWFKHISDSLDDPFIFDLVSKFGGDGYLVFFGVLEIYSREFKTELGWNLKVTRAYLRQKLQKRQDTLVINCLKHIQNSGKWKIDFIEDQVIIFIPKFTEIIDEWTSRKLVSKSGVTPKILTHDKEEDKELDKDNKEIVAPVVEKVKESKVSKVKEYPDWLSRESLDAFIEMRKKLRKPLTDKAIEMTIAKLKGFRDKGFDPNEIINESVMRGWQGVFEPKDNNPKFKLQQPERQKSLEEQIS